MSKSKGQGAYGSLAFFVFAMCFSLPILAQTFEASNGMTFKVLNTYVIDNRNRGSDKSYVGALIENDDNQLTTFVFDCDGYYAIETGGHAGWHRVAPRSVLASVSRTACAKSR